MTSSVADLLLRHVVAMLAHRWGRVAAVTGLLGTLAVCGGSSKPPGNEASREAPAVRDPRTPIEKRRDVACDSLGPKLTTCAVEDASADLAAGKIGKSQFDRDTAPEVQHKNTAEFVKACKSSPYSSRQVRVLEVCFREETRCAPLIECLGHLNDTGAGGK